MGQGFLSTIEQPEAFSEGIWLTYQPATISLDVLIDIHLSTHRSGSNHSMRHKYRSGIYWVDEETRRMAGKLLREMQDSHGPGLVTGLYELAEFRDSPERFRDYYARNPQAPFCTTYIDPKMEWLRRKYPGYFKGIQDEFTSARGGAG